MKIKINNDQLTILTVKQRFYTTLNKSFTKTFFKITPDSFHLYLRGDNGALETILGIENIDNFTDTKYVSVDYMKWNLALQKFSLENGLILEVTNNAIRIREENSTNSISLGIVNHKADSSEANVIDNLIPTKKTEVQNSGLCLTLTDEMINNFNLASSLFVVQGRTNSIGLSKDDVMYADRSIVLKINLSEPIDENFFSKLTEGTHVYLHSAVLDLFDFMYTSNKDVYFSDDYRLIYWSDDVSSIIFASGEHEIALPDKDDWEGIKPSDTSTYFNVALETINDSLDFFVGFYENSMWKPLTFSVNKRTGVTLNYKQPTTEVKKELPTSECTGTGQFQLDSETLKKVVVKVAKNYSSDEEIRFNFDEDAPGIYCTVRDRYEVVFSKLESDD